MSTELDRSRRPAHQTWRRRIEAHRLLKDRLNQGKLRKPLAIDQSVADKTPNFFARSVLPIREQREEVECPGKRLCGGLMAGEQESHQVVNDQAVRHRFASGRIPRRHQPSHQIVAFATMLSSSGKCAAGELAQVTVRLRHA
jgi:hypothetical protein